jgi:hypothetical protein
LVDRLERERQAFSSRFQNAFFGCMAPITIFEVHVIVPEFRLFEPGYAIVDVVEYYSDRDQWTDPYILADWVDKGVCPRTEWGWDTHALLAATPSAGRALQRLDVSSDYFDSQLAWQDSTLPRVFVDTAVDRISDLIIDHCVFELNDASQVAAFIAAQPESLRGAIHHRCAERLESVSAR